MRRSEKFSNPFYGLLLVAGIVFAMTAVAYGVMAVRENASVLPAEQAGPSPAAHPLLAWMSQYGNAALATELVVLAIGTVGAIATDDYWQRRAAAERKTR